MFWKRGPKNCSCQSNQTFLSLRILISCHQLIFRAFHKQILNREQKNSTRQSNQLKVSQRIVIFYLKLIFKHISITNLEQRTKKFNTSTIFFSFLIISKLQLSSCLPFSFWAFKNSTSCFCAPLVKCVPQR